MCISTDGAGGLRPGGLVICIRLRILDRVKTRSRPPLSRWQYIATIQYIIAFPHQCCGGPLELPFLIEFKISWLWVAADEVQHRKVAVSALVKRDGKLSKILGRAFIIENPIEFCA